MPNCPSCSTGKVIFETWLLSLGCQLSNHENEAEVMHTKDKKVILFHDVPLEANMEKLMGVSGQIADFDYAELPPLKGDAQYKLWRSSWIPFRQGVHKLCSSFDHFLCYFVSLPEALQSCVLRLTRQGIPTKCVLRGGSCTGQSESASGQLVWGCLQSACREDSWIWHPVDVDDVGRNQKEASFSIILRNFHPLW